LVPPEIFSRFATANFLLPNLPAPLPIDWAKKLGLGTLAGGLKVEEFDYLHFLIYTDEVCVSLLALLVAAVGRV